MLIPYILLVAIATQPLQVFSMPSPGICEKVKEVWEKQLDDAHIPYVMVCRQKASKDI